MPVPVCEAAMVIFDLVHDNGCGECASNVFELWLPPPWLSGFSVKLESSVGESLGIAVFRASARTRSFKGQTLRLFELVQLLPHGSALTFPPVRLTTFATQLPEFSSTP